MTTRILLCLSLGLTLGGNLPALWAYLDSIDPARGDNPEPPGEAMAPT